MSGAEISDFNTTMFDEWKTRSFRLGAVARGAGATLAVAAFFVALIVSLGQAQACPPGIKAHTPAAIAHAAKRVVLSASAAQPAQITSRAGSVSPEDHCSGASHSSASGCQIECCFACSAVINTSTAVLQCPNVSTDYSLAPQHDTLSKKISSLFRPPKFFA
jgi:hypothetical protein